MPMNKIPRLREPRGPVVQQVRDLFLATEYKEKPEEYYLEDIRLVESMDFIVQRCVIMNCKNVEGSVKTLSAILKWRKERGLYELNDTVFPQEIQMCGGLFSYESDKFGNRTLYLRASMCKNCPELKNAMKEFLNYQMFKLDDPVNGQTFAIIMDLTNTSWSNYDLDLLMHFVNSLKDQYTVNLDYVLAVNFPWILSAAWTLIKRLIPSEKRDIVQFINSDKIFDFIEKENCPDFLGGTCRRPYKFINKDAPTAIEYFAYLSKSGHKFTKKRLREILSIFSDVLPKDYVKRMESEIEKVQDGVKLADQIEGLLQEDQNNNINCEEFLKCDEVPICDKTKQAAK